MLVALCSVKGSPGVTTAAVAMAACWPRGDRPVVVECDPAGGDLLARFRLDQARGLVTLAAAARRRHADPELLWRHVQPLPGGLPVAAGPVGAEQARAALAEITQPDVSPLRVAADQPGSVVIADCGRVDPDSPALPLIAESDVMLLLARARDDQLSHVVLKLSAATRWSRQPCFVLVGNDGYPTSDVSQLLGIKIMARIPHDPHGASVLNGQPGSRASLSRSRIGQAMTKIIQLTAYHAVSAARRAPRWVAAEASPPNGHALPGLVPDWRNGAQR